jgi:lipopolysaccharide biosynthesis glycosyltransferase
MIRLFIGYDPREAVAYHVCVNALIRHSTEPLCITPLALDNLSKLYKESHNDGSNAFIYSRFLVPYLCGFSGAAIYLDGDMVVNSDISELWELRDHFCAAQVVKHAYETRAETKYLGAKNENYPRKNWSSVVLWNCGHYGNRHLTPEQVTKMSGAELHRFSWLDDDRIGSLPKSWNWLDTEYDYRADADLVHYTLGTPCWKEFAETDHAHQWHNELLKTTNAVGEMPGRILQRAEQRKTILREVSER